jgi:Tubulin binding cofactor A
MMRGSLPTTRLVKEWHHYENELVQNEATVREMKQDANQDAYDIKYHQNILNESRVMVPDAHRRLSLALEELEQQLALVVRVDQTAVLGTAAVDSDNNDDAVDEWVTTAQMLLQEHAAAFKRHDVLLTNVEGLADGEAF